MRPHIYFYKKLMGYWLPLLWMVHKNPGDGASVIPLVEHTRIRYTGAVYYNENNKFNAQRLSRLEMLMSLLLRMLFRVHAVSLFCRVICSGQMTGSCQGRLTSRPSTTSSDLSQSLANKLETKTRYTVHSDLENIDYTAVDSRTSDKDYTGSVRLKYSGWATCTHRDYKTPFSMRGGGNSWPNIPSLTNGIWQDCKWLVCNDGKHRPTPHSPAGS